MGVEAAHQRSSSLLKATISSGANEWNEASVWLRNAVTCGAAAAAPFGGLQAIVRPVAAHGWRRRAGLPLR